MSDIWSDPSSTSIFHVCEQQRLWRDCADAYVISTIISWAGSFYFILKILCIFEHCIKHISPIFHTFYSVFTVKCLGFGQQPRQCQEIRNTYRNDPKFSDRQGCGDPDQTAPRGAVWSVSTLFATTLFAILHVLDSLFYGKATLFKF